jgi:hypothetical protein
MGLSYPKADLSQFDKGVALRRSVKDEPLRERKLERQDELGELELASAKIDTIGTLLKGAVDQPTYSAKRNIGISQGLFTPDQVPEQYDPNIVAGWGNTLLNAKEDLDRRYKEAQIAQMEKGGATGAFVERLQRDPDFAAAYFGKALATKGIQKDPATGRAVEVPGFSAATGGIAGTKKREEKRAELDVKREESKTKAQTALKSFERDTERNIRSVDNALKRIAPWSAGYGAALSFMPNSDARALRNDLKEIKSRLGFDNLQEMRDNSPTGGALGQVSEMENELLQAVEGTLDQAQSEQLETNLNIIKELYPQVLAERREAFNLDYGDVAPSGITPITPPGQISTQDPRVRAALEAGYSPEEIQQYLSGAQ